MLIGAALLLCILSVPLLGGRLQALGELEFRRGGYAVAALVIQIVIISILRVDVWGLSEEIHLATYFLLGAFLIANRHIPGLLVIALGGALNFAAIASNGGVMPADPDALRAIGRSPASDEFINSTALDHPKLAFLGDIIPTPASWPVSNVYSVGDLLILTGAFVLLHVACGSRLVPRRFRRRPAMAVA